MSYAKLGTSCIQQTIAVTSNEKFILPNNPIYYTTYTNMLKYPNDEQIGKVDNLHPEHLKSYYSKDTSPRFNDNDNISEQDTHRLPVTGGCSTCG